MTWANALTMSRILAIPTVFVFWEWQSHALALAILGVALLTDFLDGKIARWLGQESSLGALLDPVADKLIVLSFVPYLCTKNVLPLWFSGIIITRNIAQLAAIPVLGWWLSIPFKVKPAFTPKVATALSFLIVFSCLVSLAPGAPLVTGGYFFQAGFWALLALSTTLEIYILATYLPRFCQIASGSHDTFE